MTLHRREAASLLVNLLCEGFPTSFVELHYLLLEKPSGSPEHPESADFIREVTSQLQLAEVSKRHGRPEGLISAYLKLSDLYRGLQQTQLGLFFIERALDLALAAGSPELECHVLRELVVTYESLSLTEQAVAAAEAHKQAAQRAGVAEEEEKAAEELVRVYRKQGGEVEGKADTAAALDAALQVRMQELAAAKECGDLEGEATATWAVGKAYMATGKSGAISFFKQYLSLAQQLREEKSDTAHIARAYASLAAAHQSAGEYANASACLQELLQVAHASGNDAARAHALDSIGILHARQGQYQEAESSLTEGYKLRRTLMASGSESANRPELDRCRTLLGLVKASGKGVGSRAGAMFDTVLANDVKKLLEWKISRNELVAVPAAPAARPSLSKLLSTSYKPAGAADDLEAEPGPSGGGDVEPGPL